MPAQFENGKNLMVAKFELALTRFLFQHLRVEFRFQKSASKNLCRFCVNERSICHIFTPFKMYQHRVNAVLF